MVDVGVCCIRHVVRGFVRGISVRAPGGGIEQGRRRNEHTDQSETWMAAEFVVHMIKRLQHQLCVAMDLRR